MASLYAIVGSMERARVMLKAGAPYLQLRFKDHPLAPHREEIAQWKTRFPETRVVINDDLEAAAELGVWGAHLGQQDLERYPRKTVRKASVAIGISTHSQEEIQRALEYRPALLGFGPIFPTGSKQVSHPPQGVERLRAVVSRIALPIAAIGGIEGENLTPVAATGVNMVAMISYLDRFTEPEEIAILAQRMARFSPHR